MVAFAQRCEVIDGMNAATILGEDKVERYNSSSPLFVFGHRAILFWD